MLNPAEGAEVCLPSPWALPPPSLSLGTPPRLDTHPPCCGTLGLWSQIPLHWNVKGLEGGATRGSGPQGRPLESAAPGVARHQPPPPTRHRLPPLLPGRKAEGRQVLPACCQPAQSWGEMVNQHPQGPWLAQLCCQPRREGGRVNICQGKESPQRVKKSGTTTALRRGLGGGSENRYRHRLKPPPDPALTPQSSLLSFAAKTTDPRSARGARGLPSGDSSPWRHSSSQDERGPTASSSDTPKPRVGSPGTPQRPSSFPAPLQPGQGAQPRIARPARGTSPGLSGAGAEPGRGAGPEAFRLLCARRAAAMGARLGRRAGPDAGSEAGAAAGCGPAP